MKVPLLPQEIEAHYVIPTIRRYLAEILKKEGMKQKDIAAIFNVKTATVSQYLNTKRGHQIQFDEEIITKIKQEAQKVKDTLSYMKVTQEILHYLRETHALCSIHKQLTNIPTGCTPAHVGCNKGGYV